MVVQEWVRRLFLIGHSRDARRLIHTHQWSPDSGRTRKVTTMDINDFVEPFQQFGQHIQDAPQQAQQFVEQHAPNLSNLCGNILGS